MSQYRENVNRVAKQFVETLFPSEGWIRTVRKSLGMSGAQLARRLGVTRGFISNTEKAELTNSVTLKTMHQMAEAMGCKFVYAIVPEVNIEMLIRTEALNKAKKLVKEASVQMALEDQALSKEKLNLEIEKLAAEFENNMISKLWNDE